MKYAYDLASKLTAVRKLSRSACMTATKALRKSLGVIIFISWTLASPGFRPERPGQMQARAARGSSACAGSRFCAVLPELAEWRSSYSHRRYRRRWAASWRRCPRRHRRLLRQARPRCTRGRRIPGGRPCVSLFYGDAGSAANIITFSFVRPTGAAPDSGTGRMTRHLRSGPLASLGAPVRAAHRICGDRDLVGWYELAINRLNKLLILS